MTDFSDRLTGLPEAPEEWAEATESTNTRAADRTVRAEDNGEAILDNDGVAFEELDVERPDEINQQSATIRQLAVDEQVWRFGHVIVDEAQDLTPMQWRMVVRRSRRGAVTVLGDLAQRSIGEPGTWADHLPPEFSNFEQRSLTTNYRSPAEVNDLATGILERLVPDLPESQAVRRSGNQVVVKSSPDVSRAAAEVASEFAAIDGPDGRSIAIIGFDLDVSDREREGLVPAGGRVLTPWTAKGLEFDSVVVVEPARFLDHEGGLSLLYVALTRSTNRLAIVHSRPLPAVLADSLSLR